MVIDFGGESAIALASHTTNDWKISMSMDALTPLMTPGCFLPLFNSALHGSLNREPVLIGCDKSGNGVSAEWQVTLCESTWHVSSRSSDP